MQAVTALQKPAAAGPELGGDQRHLASVRPAARRRRHAGAEPTGTRECRRAPSLAQRAPRACRGGATAAAAAGQQRDRARHRVARCCSAISPPTPQCSQPSSSRDQRVVPVWLAMRRRPRSAKSVPSRASPRAVLNSEVSQAGALTAAAAAAPASPLVRPGCRRPARAVGTHQQRQRHQQAQHSQRSSARPRPSPRASGSAELSSGRSP